MPEVVLVNFSGRIDAHLPVWPATIGEVTGDLAVSGHVRLVRLEATDDTTLESQRSSLDFVLVVVLVTGRLLVVFDRMREQWELPGGQIDLDEQPHAAAARELFEETGYNARTVTIMGIATYRTGSDDSMARGAIFVADLHDDSIDRASFVPNDEIEDIKWWDMGGAIEPFSPLNYVAVKWVIAQAAGLEG